MWVKRRCSAGGGFGVEVSGAAISSPPLRARRSSRTRALGLVLHLSSKNNGAFLAKRAGPHRLSAKVD